MTGVRKALARQVHRLANWLAPGLGLEAQIRAYMAHPAFKAVVKAVKKQESDPVLHGAPAEDKYKEALQWAEYYGDRAHARRDAWLTRFLLELAVGLEKGKLTI